MDPNVLAVSLGGSNVRPDVAFNGPILLARYDGCNLEVLPASGCFAQGRYRFQAITAIVQAERRILRNRAELIAEAPFLAAEIGGSLRTTEGVGLVLAQSGYWEIDHQMVSRSNLQGDPGCVASATHFIRMAAAGAYEAYREDLQELEAQGNFMFVGARGGTAYGHSTFARAGDINACFAGNQALCSSPLRFRLAPIASAGASVQCPAGQVEDGRGGCLEYIAPWTPFLLSVGVSGSCSDGAGQCEYNLGIEVGNRQVDFLHGPQDAGWMAATPVRHSFRASDLDQGVTVNIWERDFMEHDRLGSCLVRKPWQDLVSAVHRARSGQGPMTERMPCGGQELLFTIQPR